MHKETLTIISLAVKDFDVGRSKVVRAREEGFGVYMSIVVTFGGLVGETEVGVGARGGMRIVGEVKVVSTKCRSVAGVIVYTIMLILVHSAREDTVTVTSK